MCPAWISLHNIQTATGVDWVFIWSRYAIDSDPVTDTPLDHAMIELQSSNVHNLFHNPHTLRPKGEHRRLASALQHQHCIEGCGGCDRCWWREKGSQLSNEFEPPSPPPRSTAPPIHPHHQQQAKVAIPRTSGVDYWWYYWWYDWHATTRRQQSEWSVPSLHSTHCVALDDTNPSGKVNQINGMEWTNNISTIYDIPLHHVDTEIRTKRYWYLAAGIWQWYLPQYNVLSAEIGQNDLDYTPCRSRLSWLLIPITILTPPVPFLLSQSKTTLLSRFYNILGLHYLHRLRLWRRPSSN